MYPLTLGISDSQFYASGIAETYIAKVLAVGGTLTTTEQNAVIQFVDDLETIGIIDDFDIILPILGGTSASCKINLFDPDNTLYDWDYLGSPTFSSTGIKGNATNAAVRSLWKINGLAKANNTNAHISTYLKYYSGGSGLTGVIDTAGSPYVKAPVCGYYGSSYGGMWTDSFGSLWAPGASSFEGFMYSDNRYGATSEQGQRFYYNNILRGNTSLAPSSFTNDSGFALLNLYWYTQNATHVYNGEFSNDEYRFFSIGKKLEGGSGTKRTDFYNAVQTFQTTIGRNV